MEWTIYSGAYDATWCNITSTRCTRHFWLVGKMSSTTMLLMMTMMRRPLTWPVMNNKDVELCRDRKLSASREATCGKVF